MDKNIFALHKISSYSFGKSKNYLSAACCLVPTVLAVRVIDLFFAVDNIVVHLFFVLFYVELLK